MNYPHTFSLDDVGKDMEVSMYSFTYAVSSKVLWRTVPVHILMVVTSPAGTIALFRPKREFRSGNYNRFNIQTEAIRAFMEQ